MGWSPARARSDTYPLPLEVKSGRITLTHSLLALQKGSRVFLPLDALAAAFDFVVEIRAAEAYADGWFLAEDRKFTIDLESGEATSEGRRIDAPRKSFITSELQSTGELYVARALLNRIWPVDMDVDMASLTLNVNPEEPLPAERRRKREQRRERLLSRGGADRDLRPVRHPYKMFSQPAFDFTTTLDVDRRRVTGRQQINWAHDILGVASRGLATFRMQDGDANVDNIQLTFRRSDIVEDLPLGLRDVQVGDVSRQPQNRIGGLSRGRGAVVSSFPVNRADEFDTTTIEGSAPVGYEAELYRNGRLLDFQRVDENGRYSFTEVPLIFGFNRFRVVLYGPQGQLRERVQTIDTSQALARPGQTLSRLSVIETGRDFIPVGDERRVLDEVGLSLNGMVAHGLSKDLSAFAAASSIPTQSGTTQYAIGGVNTPFMSGNAQIRALASARGGFGVDLRTLQRLDDTRISLQSGYFRDFESPDVGFGNSATTFDTRLRSNSTVDLGVASLGLEFDGEFERRQDGRSGLTLQASQRLRDGRYSLIHTVDRAFGDLRSARTRGQLDANVRLRPVTLRGGMSYDVTTGLQQARGDIRYRRGADFTAGANVSFDFNRERTVTNLDLTRVLGRVLASLTAGWDEGRGFRFGLRLNFGLGPDAHESYAMSPEHRSTRGSVRARVFVDADSDGTYDDGEQPVEGARLGGRLPGPVRKTDSDGLVQINGLRPLEPTPLYVREGSLSNPFWLPADEGYSFVPRPGTVSVLDIPVTQTGSIDGVVRLAQTGAGLPGVNVQVIDDDGEVVKETNSFFDGFFAFDQIRYGTYRLRIGQSARFAVVEGPGKIVVDAESPFALEQDIVIERRAAR